MRKLILSMHISLDGFVAGPKGEMNWIHVDDELFEYSGMLTDAADTALYGRVTYEMMDNYWPTAGEQPGASKHDIQHSGWYNSVKKVVVSNSWKEANRPNVQVVGDNLAEQIRSLKEEPGKNIQIFGSPGACHSLMQYQLIDEYWLFINPVLLGSGTPLFRNINEIEYLKLLETTVLASGVLGVHYGRK
ncbi:dihydrofolate reductase family protein [Larkinella terrae]|uniref:Dihydrofolate reductase n=1 Tax=Larkinella terrae TaxID=2025311 RepID=A0A7K0EJJ0_9BACT|nr:dihydrofolate reductase family protein [Larkinella terrae]MRS61912.1 dihydrofolate reductase [Larkinella terrae]